MHGHVRLRMAMHCNFLHVYKPPSVLKVNLLPEEWIESCDSGITLVSVWRQFGYLWVTSGHLMVTLQ